MNITFANSGEKKEICVLGATGFVGRQLCARFASEGFHIRALTRRAASNDAINVIPTLRLIECNVHDPQTLLRQFAGCHGVINLIGILNERGHRGEGFRHAHVVLADKVVSACQAAGVERLLHMSAINASVAAPSHYLRSKAEAEVLVRSAESHNLHTTIFQPSVIFGPGDDFINRFDSLLRLTPLLPLACPHARFAPIYVQDVTAAFARSYFLHQSWGRTYELCGPEEYSLLQLVRLIARVGGHRRWIAGLSDRLSWLQAALFEWFPGKPFSLDNYHSLQTDAICRDDGCARLGITPASLSALMPLFLGKASQAARLYDMRSVHMEKSP